MKTEVGPVCRERMYSERWRSPNLRHKHVRPSVANKQNLLSSLKTKEHHSILQSTLSRHQVSLVWRCHGMSGNLVRGTRDLSPAASRWFPMVFRDTANTIFFFLDAVPVAIAARKTCRFWRVSVVRGRPEPGIWAWECMWAYWLAGHGYTYSSSTMCMEHMLVNSRKWKPKALFTRCTF